MNFPLIRKVYGMFPYTFCLALLAMTSFSCESDVDTITTLQLQEGAGPTAPNQLNELINNAEGNMFHFVDFAAFNRALNAVASPTNKPLSTTELRAIEDRLGVNTLQGVYLDLVDEFDGDVPLPSSWFSDHEHIIAPFEGGLSPVIHDVAIRTLVNEEGRVKIGKDLYVFTKDIQLVAKNNPDVSVVEDAVKKATSSIEDGIFVQTPWQEDEMDFMRKSCNGASSLGCTAAEVSDHRVRGNWGYSFTYQVTINETCIGIPGEEDDEDCFPSSLTYTISPRYFANAKVEDRGLFNRWTRDNTRLSFTCGVRAQGLSGSGMGWTSSTDVHEINVAWSAGPTENITLPAGNGQAPPVPVRQLDYVTGGVDDEDIPGLFCFKCCPWDCANLDENDIP